jgi:hypothetical protein
VERRFLSGKSPSATFHGICAILECQKGSREVGLNGSFAAGSKRRLLAKSEQKALEKSHREKKGSGKDV